MKKQTTSLRFHVHDWLGSVDNLRVSRPARSKDMPCRAVRIEVTRAAAEIAIVFFRHRDGSWCVYPPSAFSPATKLFIT